MKYLISLIVCFSATSAVAHPGHLVDAMGHDHWVAGAAVGIAVVIGAWTALKGKTKPQADETDAAESDAEPQEA